MPDTFPPPTLVQEANKLGLSIPETQLAQFQAYTRLLQSWNQKMNLTAIREGHRIVTHHFLDSLVLVSYLSESPSLSLVDVGSGAGFPGAVCAIMRPSWKVTLVERIQKKAAFLLALRRELGLSFEVLATDVNQLKRQFDYVVSRATFPPPVWLQVGASLVAEDGYLFAMLGPSAPQLTPPLGFEPRIDVSYDVGAGRHTLKGYYRTAR